MKYVIELSEYIKHEVDIEEDVDKAEDFIKWYSATLTREIKDSTPLQAELEEIEADIKDTIKKFETSFGDTYSMNYLLYYVDKIFDNRISELKGENKKECSTCKSDNSHEKCLGCIEYGHWELKGENNA